MNESYPVPPPELLEEWEAEVAHTTQDETWHVAKRAAAWGYQQCADEIAAETERRWLDGETD